MAFVDTTSGEEKRIHAGAFAEEGVEEIAKIGLGGDEWETVAVGGEGVLA